MPIALAVVAAGAIGAGATAYSASKAADAQTKASNNAIAAQNAQIAQNREDTAPFREAGVTATNMLTGQLPALTAPMQMTQAQLEATPGYQFNLSQGLKATQNSAAARGLGLSGAAMKGAANYATGLADSTYTNQFNMDQTNKTNAYNKLLGVSQLGANAASGNASNATTLTQGVANNLTGIGNAQAGAAMATGNALTSGANSLTNYLMQSQYGGGNALTGMYTPSVPAGGYAGMSPGGTPYSF